MSKIKRYEIDQKGGSCECFVRIVTEKWIAGLKIMNKFMKKTNNS